MTTSDTILLALALVAAVLFVWAAMLDQQRQIRDCERRLKRQGKAIARLQSDLALHRKALIGNQERLAAQSDALACLKRSTGQLPAVEGRHRSIEAFCTTAKVPRPLRARIEAGDPALAWTPEQPLSFARQA